MRVVSSRLDARGYIMRMWKQWPPRREQHIGPVVGIGDDGER